MDRIIDDPVVLEVLQVPEVLEVQVPEVLEVLVPEVLEVQVPEVLVQGCR